VSLHGSSPHTAGTTEIAPADCRNSDSGPRGSFGTCVAAMGSMKASGRKSLRIAINLRSPDPNRIDDGSNAAASDVAGLCLEGSGIPDAALEPGRAVVVRP
jgi:hypothetical protein